MGSIEFACKRFGSKVLQENHPYGPGFIFVGILIFSDTLPEAWRNAESVEDASEWGITFSECLGFAQ
jgi:hypothetical protein